MFGKFFHDIETPNLKNNFFHVKKNLIKTIPKTLIISGGSRNGNHLVWSLLDGNSQIPYLPGEDKFLSEIFWKSFRNFKKFKKDFLKDKFNFYRKLNGISYDKWEKVFKKQIDKKKWAGAYRAKRSAPLQEFPDHYVNINYLQYREYIKKNIKKNFNFFYFYNFYLKAFSKLSPQKNQKLLKFKYIYAESGLRRELLYLLKNNANIKCCVPIRKFESFYYSIIKTLFKKSVIKKEYLKEAWERWYHKTNDYLFLKKKYPKNILLIRFEDLEKKQSRKIAVKKICTKLGIKFEQINLTPTHFKKRVLPNSSFISILKKNKKSGYRLINEKNEKKYKFPREKLPIQYLKYYKDLSKYFY